MTPLLAGAANARAPAFAPQPESAFSLKWNRRRRPAGGPSGSRCRPRSCEACRLKPQCCPKEPARYIPRSIYEGARDMARQIASSWEGRTARRLRKKVEMLFAHLKRILRLDWLSLRGPNGG